MTVYESEIVISELPRDCGERDVGELGELLIDAVDSGAAVSFLAPLSIDRATEWWRTTLSGLHPKAVVLVARRVTGGEKGPIVGTAQLQPAWAPNQPHRAEVCKVIVHRRERGKGLGRQLMLAAESVARRNGFSLLTLDAKAGGPAEDLYRNLGWTRVGEIPRYALDADGRGMHGTVIFYKQLDETGLAGSA